MSLASFLDQHAAHLQPYQRRIVEGFIRGERWTMTAWPRYGKRYTLAECQRLHDLFKGIEANVVIVDELPADGASVALTDFS